MRTSRVQRVPSSIFRNSRQYLHSNEQVFRLMAELDAYGQGNGQQKRENQKKQTDKKIDKRKYVIKNKQQRLIVKGINSDATSIVDLQNKLLQQTIKLNNAIKKSRIRTYRNSI